MPRVSRSELEKWHALRRARAVARSVLEDTALYPDDEFLMRRGLCKDLVEEYVPLVRLAGSLCGVRGIRLMPESNQGPDAQIAFWLRTPWNVQITCSMEGHDRALMREQMLQPGDVLSGGSGRRWRDKSSGMVVSDPTGFSAAQDIVERVERIGKSVAAKERNFHAGTDTLLIDEDPAGFSYLVEGDLSGRVVEAVRALGPSRYRRRFVAYGERIERLS